MRFNIYARFKMDKNVILKLLSTDPGAAVVVCRTLAAVLFSNGDRAHKEESN